MEVTVNFSVYTYADVGYDLWAIIDEVYNLNFTLDYWIDFSKYESRVLKLSGEQLVRIEEVVVMVLIYNISWQASKFKAKISIDGISNSEACCK
jgi:hypothetical protein